MDMSATVANAEKHTSELRQIQAFMNEFAADVASLIQAHRGQVSTFTAGQDPIVYFTARMESHLKEMGYV